MEKDILFSIFMCVRNAERTIERAVRSVEEQTCLSWELLIVDNGSKDGTWMLVEDMMERDPRIKGIHLEQGVGWAKGSALCLERAEGKYMTFLAADDFFLGNGALCAVEKCIEEENPEIVWIGHAAVRLANNSYGIVGGLIPEYKVYQDKDKITEIYEIMNNLYYNSFFHFMRIEHLKSNKIDFLEPFFADCEGVTEAMCKAEKTVVLDQAVYALTLNTSQASDAAIWGEYTVQWKSVKNAVCEKGSYDRRKCSYIAIRIFNNNLARLKRICSGNEVRNLEMNPISKTPLERLQHMEAVLETPEYCDMFYYAGRDRYTDELIENIKLLYEQCINVGYTQEEISKNVKWLDRLILGFYKFVGEKLVKRIAYKKEDFENIRDALCNEANIGCFGYELTAGVVYCITEELQGMWQEIFQAYMQCNLRRIYELLFTAVEIKKRNGAPEVLEIVKESMEILQQVKAWISEEELRKVAGDIKMVAEMR